MTAEGNFLGKHISAFAEMREKQRFTIYIASKSGATDRAAETTEKPRRSGSIGSKVTQAKAVFQS